MKKIKCNCGRMIEPKNHNAFLFDGLKFECKNCKIKLYGSGFGYQQAAEEIKSKLEDLRNNRLKSNYEPVYFKPKKFAANIKVSKKVFNALMEREFPE